MIMLFLLQHHLSMKSLNRKFGSSSNTKKDTIHEVPRTHHIRTGHSIDRSNCHDDMPSPSIKSVAGVYE